MAPEDFSNVRNEELASIGREGSADLWGLALSGGGIRSATFCLGILQALAQLKLLRNFDYLSTVSGGGYIGSWLSAWIKRHAQGLTGVQQDLTPGTLENPRGAEPREIVHLRSYSNYLTPKSGLFTADTWAGVATYTRNYLLNTVIFVSLTAALLMLPLFAVWLGKWLTGINCGIWGAIPIGLLGVVILMTSLNQFGDGNETGWRGAIATQKWILVLVVAPAIGAAWLGSVWFLSRIPYFEQTNWKSYALGAALTYLVLSVLALFTAQTDGAAKGSVVGGIREKFNYAKEKFHIVGVSGAFVYFLILVIAIGCGFALLAGFAELIKLFGDVELAVWPVTVIGTPLLLGIFGVAVTLQIGLMGRFFPEDDREWWSRFGGWLMIGALVWVAVFGAAIYGPLLVILMRDWARELSVAWVLTTVGGVLAGRSEQSSKPKPRWYVKWLAKLAPSVFVVGFFLFIAWGLHLLLPWWAQIMAGTGAPRVVTDCHTLGAILHPQWCTAYFDRLATSFDGSSFALLSILLAIGLLFSWRVDVNLFSFHMFYRNRLIRAYLGASNPVRNPHPFTDFDPEDAPALKDLRVGKRVQRPLHLINTALNITSGERLAWQERKAASFVMSPLWCGYQFPGDPGNFQRTEDYVKGRGWIGLGTAMAISGAAASPNMGYHSSPPMAFLLTLFNVRLGWWMQNPRLTSVWQTPGPLFGLIQLVKELCGLSNEKSKYLYLSDGGHFDNLGIYELVRRRCKFILAIDAGEDHEFVFDDLGNSIRKCYVDFGVRIEMKDMHGLKDRQDQWKSNRHCAVGIIHYEEADRGAETGTLLYIKPSLTGEEPADILNYHDRNSQFPHQGTTDQWFDESQFEAYRKLGLHIGMEVLHEGATDIQRVAEMPARLAARWSEYEKNGKGHSNGAIAKPG